jgi:hypothetical protein
MINVLKEIDGQIITQTEEGLLIINDPRSPYSGLSVFEYYALCKVYYSQQKQKERDKLKQVQEQCRLEGKTVPNHLGVQAPHKVSRSSLPKFPAGVKNWLKESPPLQQRVRKK